MMLNSNLAVMRQEKDLRVVTDSFLKSLDHFTGQKRQQDDGYHQ